MNTIPFEGKNLRVWSREELAKVHAVDSSSAGVRRAAAGQLTVRPDGSPVLTWASACHPIHTMENNPEHLCAEYHKDRGVLVLRCHVCGAPVLAVWVA